MQDLDGRVRVGDHVLEQRDRRDGQFDGVLALGLLHSPVLVCSCVVVGHVRRVEVVVAQWVQELELVGPRVHDQSQAVGVNHDLDKVTPHAWIAGEDKWGYQMEQLLGVLVSALVEEVVEQRAVAEEQYMVSDTLDHSILHRSGSACSWSVNYVDYGGKTLNENVQFGCLLPECRWVVICWISESTVGSKPLTTLVFRTVLVMNQLIIFETIKNRVDMLLSNSLALLDAWLRNERSSSLTAFSSYTKLVFVYFIAKHFDAVHRPTRRFAKSLLLYGGSRV